MTADVFERHVRRFDEVLGFLERLAETPWDRFRDDPEKYGSAERFLKVPQRGWCTSTSRSTARSCTTCCSTGSAA